MMPNYRLFLQHLEQSGRKTSKTTSIVVIAPSYKTCYTKESTNLGITRLQASVSVHHPVPPLPRDRNAPLSLSHFMLVQWVEWITQYYPALFKANFF